MWLLNLNCCVCSRLRRNVRRGRRRNGGCNRSKWQDLYSYITYVHMKRTKSTLLLILLYV